MWCIVVMLINSDENWSTINEEADCVLRMLCLIYHEGFWDSRALGVGILMCVPNFTVGDQSSSDIVISI